MRTKNLDPRVDKGIGRRATGSTASENKLAATLKGHIYTSRASETGNVQVGPLLEGMYTGGGTHTHRLSEVACPYCREPMTEAFGHRPHRIARVLRMLPDRRALVIGVRVPRSHRILGCKVCKTAFTSPKKRRESAPAVSAVDPHAASTGTPTTRETE